LSIFTTDEEIGDQSSIVCARTGFDEVPEELRGVVIAFSWAGCSCLDFD
jgi:hypothetical protein